jgi:hypothetical protein
MSVDVGELYPMGITVRDVDPARTPINAANVTLAITRPDQTPEPGIVIGNPPGLTGRYTFDYIPLQPGRYVYRWATTNPTLVLEGSFDANPTGSAGLISLARAKNLLRIPLDDDTEDDDVRSVIRAATRAAENERHEVIQRRAVTETKRLRALTLRTALTYLPVLSLTTATNLDDGTVWLPPAIDVDEHGIAEVAFGVAAFGGRVRFDYVAGYAVVPDAYQEATGYIVQHLWENRLGSQRRPRVGGMSGGEDVPPTMGYSIPNRARDLLGRAGPLVG